VQVKIFIHRPCPYLFPRFFSSTTIIDKKITKYSAVNEICIQPVEFVDKCRKSIAVTRFFWYYYCV